MYDKTANRKSSKTGLRSAQATEAMLSRAGMLRIPEDLGAWRDEGAGWRKSSFGRNSQDPQGLWVECRLQNGFRWAFVGRAVFQGLHGEIKIISKRIAEEFGRLQGNLGDSIGFRHEFPCVS